MRKTTAWYLLSVLALMSAMFLNASQAQAIFGGEWTAGNIISDSEFYNNSKMSATDIQNFLNQKVPACDTWGTQIATEYGSTLTRAVYAKNKWSALTPFVCLKDYYQVPRSDQVVNNINTALTIPVGALSAAQIIKSAADTYRINPRVLLVTLQKESVGPLATDTWPIASQYRNAMGYACPDGAPCDPTYEGFYNQVMNAARQFGLYRDNPNSYRYKPLQENTIYYNPGPYDSVNKRYYGAYGDKADIDYCGNSKVYLYGSGTAGLYNYTPYQPNAAALNNLYGTGDICSAYGNRNFWRYYADWFPDSRWPVKANSVYSSASWSTTNTRLVSSGDINGDGKSDIVAMYDYGNSNMGIWLFTSNGSTYVPSLLFMSKSWNVQNTTQLKTGDFNGDGKDEIAAMYDYGNNTMGIWVFQYDGIKLNAGLPFLSGRGYWSTLNTPFLAAGDFNNDGKDDLAAMYNYGNSTMGIWTFLSNSGVFAPVMTFSTKSWVTTNTKFVVAGNFDGQPGDELAAMYSYGPNATGIWNFIPNQGSKMSAVKSFGSNGWYSANTKFFESGDLDGDGKADIFAMYDYGGSNMGIWAFTSVGSAFNATQKFGSPAWATSNTKFMTAGDFDGDGKCELSAMYSYGNLNMGIWNFKEVP